MNLHRLACLLLSCVLTLTLVSSHGLLCEPRQRGAISVIIAGDGKIRPAAPKRMRFPRRSIDWWPHFPAGDKRNEEGIALKSQMRGGKYNWTPYEPTRRNFVFRTGVCGDMKKGMGPQEHLKGGRYYFPPKSPFITRYYRQGSIMSASVCLTAHHNGYYEFTICDVKRCGGEISEACLRNGKICRKLKRVWERRCELGWSKSCGPIDPNYPTRWYLPCSTVYPRSVYERQWHIKYHLPKDLVCKHCVIQWYWVSANECNPPGLVEYYRGPRGPFWWGKCKGQGDAVGGYRPAWTPCGGRIFPEEYYTCADVAILPRRGMSRVPARYKHVPKGHNPIRYVIVYVNGRRVGTVKNGGRFYWPAGRKPATFEAVPFKGPWAPQFVFFAVQGIRRRWLEYRAPYIFLGNKGRIFGMGRTMPRHQWFWVQITSRNRFGRLHFTSFELYFGKEKQY